jgi:hypothetical protein
MIRIVRKRTGQGAKMFRVWCDDCADYCQGNGRSRYLSWWMVKAGAVKAAQRHQDQHAATRYIYGMAQDKRPPNSGDYQEVSSIPVRPRR